MQFFRMGFIPSSWNYGSFHQTNPRFSKVEKPVKIQVKENQKTELFPVTNTNKYGKRILNNEEKIGENEKLQ